MNDSIERKRACLSAATEACCGDRALNYGAPEDNFLRIAKLWSAWIAIRDTTKRPSHSTEYFDPFDIAIMMDLVKTARLANSPGHQDSWIDKAGYAACGADITAESFDLGKQKRSDEGLTGQDYTAQATSGTPRVAPGLSDLTQEKAQRLFQRHMSGKCYNCGGSLIARISTPEGGIWCSKCGWKQ